MALLLVGGSGTRTLWGWKHFLESECTACRPVVELACSVVTNPSTLSRDMNKKKMMMMKDVDDD
eukprot:3355026-Karenia_brevis.AAC.1